MIEPSAWKTYGSCGSRMWAKTNLGPGAVETRRSWRSSRSVPSLTRSRNDCCWALADPLDPPKTRSTAGAIVGLVEHGFELARLAQGDVLVGDLDVVGRPEPRAQLVVAVAAGLQEPADLVVLDQGPGRRPVAGVPPDVSRQVVEEPHVQGRREREVGRPIVRVRARRDMEALAPQPVVEVARDPEPSLDCIGGAITVEDEEVDVALAAGAADGGLNLRDQPARSAPGAT